MKNESVVQEKKLPVEEKPNLDEIKTRHKKVYEVQITLEDDSEKEFIFIFKKPQTISFDRVLKTMSKGMSKAMKAFTLENIIDEQKQEYEAAIEEYPGLTMSVGKMLLAMLGVTDSVNLKKL